MASTGQGQPLQDQAETLVSALMTLVRTLGGSRAGTYRVAAELHEDGSYHWHWNWWPPSDRQGGSAGKLYE